jgi:riboflavin biosynthesis pyrimidine reductase
MVPVSVARITGLSKSFLDKGRQDDLIILQKASLSGNESTEVVGIADRAFQDRELFETVRIGCNLISIGTEAFYGCGTLESVIFDEHSRITRIDARAFMYSGIQKISFPKSLLVIEESAFLGCRELASVTFEAGSQLTDIKAYAFTFTNIEEIIIPMSAKVIGKAAFGSCPRLKRKEYENGSPVKSDNEEEEIQPVY